MVERLALVVVCREGEVELLDVGAGGKNAEVDLVVARLSDGNCSVVVVDVLEVDQVVVGSSPFYLAGILVGDS